jgi:hypothetical protein
MRQWIAGLSFLAAVTFVAQPSWASFIENPTLISASTPWSFSTLTNTFSGGAGFSTPDGSFAAEGSLRALFDDEGVFKQGSVELRAPSGNHLLLLGKVTGISATASEGVNGLDDHYLVLARFVPTVQHDLPFPVAFGDFYAYVCSQTGDCESDGPASVEGLFTTDYADSHVPLNNLIRTFHIPAPMSLVLLGVGLGILALTRRRVSQAQS